MNEMKLPKRAPKWAPAPASRRLAPHAGWLAVTTTALLLSQPAVACKDGEHATSPRKAAAPVAANAKSHGHDHASTSSHAKIGQKANGSGVRMTSKTPKSVAVGERTQVSLSFDAVNQDGATVSVRAPEGMTISRVDGGSLQTIALSKGAKTDVAFWVTSSEDGTQYFDVTTTQGDRTSIQQVAVRVGSGVVRLKSNGTLITTPSGEKVISMQAK
jgi:hypothetical protein